MATNNSINNTSNPLASSAVTIDPGASGDSYVQFDINTTGEFRIGVDDNDGDAFVVSQGSALGTNNFLHIDASGNKTLPSQSCFLASVGSEDNATGDGTTHYVGSITATTEIIDRNSDFTTGNGAGTGATYTAPVTGVYIFNFMLGVDVDASGGDTMTQQIETSNRGYGVCNMPTENLLTNFSGINGDLTFNGSAVADMDASDTAQFRVTINDGSKVDDVIEGYIAGGLVA